MNRITIGMALVGATLAGPAIAQDLAGYYGFLTPEIYKLDSRSSNLTSVDLNGDGLQDIVIVNNAKSQIDVLLQRRKADDGETSLVGQETNEILSSSRMISRRIPMQRPISTLVVKDVNGDKKPDLVYIGAEPNGLYVEYQNADGTFGDRRSFEIDDAATNSWTVDVGDVNGDGRDDIVFLGKENLYIILQNQQGRLDDPRKFRTSSNNPGLLKVVDLDEDGRVDVIYTTEDPQFPVRLRFQNKQGRLGPEHQLEIERPGAVAYGKLNPAKPGINMLTITQLNARMLCYGLGEAKPKDGAPVSQTMTYPFEKTGAAPNVDLAIADFDGDGKADIAVSDPNGARIMLYRQSEVEGLDLGSPFPAMLGTAALRTIVGADGKPTLLALSTSEKSIGWTRFEGGRLGFPQLAPTKDEPVALEVAGGAKPRLLYVARVEDAANFSEKFILRALTPVEGGGFAPAKLGAADELKLDIAARPRDLRAVDANGDG
ncbi:MAG TPA: VCBS repeat-containing protein, partial [Planctomycetia bacterium]|nr:VCBS repeat-containing protein [Planctomycetia bacterium]